MNLNPLLVCWFGSLKYLFLLKHPLNASYYRIRISSMALVSYSDSDNPTGDPKHKIKGNSGTKCAIQSLKRKMIDSEGSTLPPLPDAFHDLYPSAKRKSNQDDPSLHSGRQRLTPHVEGSWPTHVYLECEPPGWGIAPCRNELELTERRASCKGRNRKIGKSACGDEP